MGGLPAILNLYFIVLTKSATFEPGKLPTKSTPVYWLITSLTVSNPTIILDSEAVYSQAKSTPVYLINTYSFLMALLAPASSSSGTVSFLLVVTALAIGLSSFHSFTQELKDNPWDTWLPGHSLPLSHHFVVWLAAELVYPGVVTPFRNSAILGDDIVILDSLVAAKYSELLDDLGVKIEPMKSLSLESALLIAFGLKYGVKRFYTLARLGGAGYRVAGSCDRTDTGSAFAELKVIPEDLMSEDDLQFLERTMLRHWVLQWLKLVSWYYTVLASDYVTIEEALSGPVVATDWRAQKDVNSALLNGRDGVMFCTGTLTSIVSGHTLVQQAGVTQPTAGPCIARGNRKCAPAHQLKKGGILPYYYEKGKGKGLISRKQHKELLIVNPEMKLQQILLSRLPSLFC
ncbi:hypothetical protein L6452_39399 [Arctium lappa]|uniref:Uncharacterized protein n=1 Tax=Arctium lappa TaxID=4217 RepID=A0ACB8XRK1_ARCLA|nr:hypothetical protein L6452_39399 [Arctium lappa]